LVLKEFVGIPQFTVPVRVYLVAAAFVKVVGAQ
jgi:hypothetical protein